jgi:hypothetical protein
MASCAHDWAFASWIAAGEGVEETTFVDVTDRRRSSGPNVRDYTCGVPEVGLGR